LTHTRMVPGMTRDLLLARQEDFIRAALDHLR
jgi:hypothetical protein